MSEMEDSGWDELAEVWREQPVPDFRKISAKVQAQHRRMILAQTSEFAATIAIVVLIFVVFDLTSDAWFRSFTLVLAGYAILQQYLMVKSAKGLWRHDAENVKDMLEHLIRQHKQRIYRLRLRLLEAAVIAAASIFLVWHLTSGSWNVLISNSTPRFFAIFLTGGIIVNLLWVFLRMPRFRRALHEAERLRETLSEEEDKE